MDSDTGLLPMKACQLQGDIQSSCAEQGSGKGTEGGGQAEGSKGQKANSTSWG